MGRARCVRWCDSSSALVLNMALHWKQDRDLTGRGGGLFWGRQGSLSAPPGWVCSSTDVVKAEPQDLLVRRCRITCRQSDKHLREWCIYDVYIYIFFKFKINVFSFLCVVLLIYFKILFLFKQTKKWPYSYCHATLRHWHSTCER